VSGISALTGSRPGIGSGCPRTLAEAAIAWVQHKRTGVRIVHSDKIGAVCRPDNRDRELDVIAVEAGAGRAAFLPVMCARPSRAAK
jgi:hypothetical protein